MGFIAVGRLLPYSSCAGVYTVRVLIVEVLCRKWAIPNYQSAIVNRNARSQNSGALEVWCRCDLPVNFQELRLPKLSGLPVSSGIKAS
jgi:hypothetical protein